MTPAPLPVELARFTASARAATVGLSWKTASERNSACFVVERSATATDAFAALGKVAAAGSSTQPLSYSFTDAHPLPLGYYRLRQVDADGATTFSPVVAVQATPVLVLQAYPNPAGESLTVAGPAGTAFTLFNQLGQAVRQGQLAALQMKALDLHTLPAGAYFLRDHAAGTALRVLKMSALD